MRLLLVFAPIATSLLVLTSIASAAVDLRVTALDCSSHPRRIRIENLGDETVNLSGWQLQSDPAEGEPYDLGQVGSLDAGKKFFVFQGHLAPETSPNQGYFRWGTGEIFYLRGNDSSDYVRIVDPQGTVVNQRNCEGLTPGATPAPPSEYDPPPLVTPEPATPTPAPAPVTAAPTATARAAPAQVAPTVRASGSASATAAPTQAVVPAVGGPPGPDQSPESIPLAAGAMAIAAGVLFVALGFKRSKREL